MTAVRLRRFPQHLQVPLALAAGVAVGLVWPSAAAKLNGVGTLYIAAVKMIVIPLVFSVVTTGMYRMAADAQSLGRLALLAFGWFYASTLVAGCVGLGINQIFRPGLGADLIGVHAADLHIAPMDLTTFLVDLIPSNIVAAMAAQKVLPTLVFAVLFGFALGKAGAERAKPVIDLLEAVLTAIFRMTHWIVALTPLVVFAMVAWLIATQSGQALLAMGKLIGTTYLAMMIVAGLIFAAIGLMRERPLNVVRRIFEPLLIGFMTRSSEVAMPIHLEKMVDLGVSKRIAAVVIPLGYSFNLDGTAVYMTSAVPFLADVAGLHLDAFGLLTILAVTMIAGKGIANVPSGSLVASATVLSAIGIPVEMLAIIATVDILIDMGRTTLNVFGNTASALFVQRNMATETSVK
jgi:DAACS family dicarboxylate/amino acid:cation (Na+ or H+) symporter